MSEKSTSGVQAVSRTREIETWLRELVRNGREGEAVPTEADLCERFGVSRMTARLAVQNLAAEGLVRRRRGAGTFIAPKPMHRYSGPLMSFTADMKRRGLTASSRLESAALRDASPAESEALGLGEALRVVAIDRIRLGDARPMAIEHAVLTPDCAPVLAADLEQGSLHEALRDLGRVPTIARTWISARIATAVESKNVQLPARAAVLVEKRIISDQRDRPLEFTTTVYNADRYVIDAVFTLAPVEEV